MKLRRFEEILDAYGATPERWPERERADALALARSSIAAARSLAEARRLDAALAAWEAHDLSVEPARFSSMLSRIVAAAAPRPIGWFVEWFGFELGPRQLWPSAAGLALMTVLGFAVGMGGLLQLESHEADDNTVVSALDFPADGNAQ